MTLKVMSRCLNRGAPLLHGVEWKEHLIDETVDTWRHLNCMERGHKRPLRGKGKKFGVAAADRGVWQNSGRG